MLDKKVTRHDAGVLIIITYALPRNSNCTLWRGHYYCSITPLLSALFLVLFSTTSYPPPPLPLPTCAWPKNRRRTIDMKEKKSRCIKSFSVIMNFVLFLFPKVRHYIFSKETNGGYGDYITPTTCYLRII